MDRKYDHNTNIIFVDAKGVRHSALVTAWWGVQGGGTNTEEVFGAPVHSYVSDSGEPGCNLVYVSSDIDRKDSCGRQMERSTSVVHKSKQAAHGMYWTWPDE